MSNLEIKRLARRLAGLERQVLLSKQPQLGSSTIDGGALQAANDDGDLTLIVGQQFDGTNAAAVVTGPTPPAPPVPFVTTAPGIARIYWDGTFADGNNAPMDFSRVLAYAEPLASYDGADPLNQALIVGEFNTATGGEISVSLEPDVEYAIYLVAWSQAGKFGTASAVATATIPAPATGGDGGPTEAPATSPAVEVYGTAEALIALTGEVDTFTTIQYHISTTPIVTPSADTLYIRSRSTVVTILTLPDGTPLDLETDYYVRAVAENAIGEAPPSAEAVARLDPAGVNRIITQEVKAGFVLAGAIRVGNITLDPNSGITIPLATGGQIKFPADGSTATITANLTTTALTALDNFRMLGTSNEVGQGAELYLSNGVVPPTVDPVVEWYYPTQNLEWFTQDATDPDLWHAIYSGDPAFDQATPKIRLLYLPAYGMSELDDGTEDHVVLADLQRYPNWPDENTGYYSEYRLVRLEGWTPFITSIRTIPGAGAQFNSPKPYPWCITTAEGHIWVGYIKAPVGGDTNSATATWHLDKVHPTTGALVQSYSLGQTPVPGARFAITSQSTSNYSPNDTIFVIWNDMTTERIKWDERDAVTMAIVNTEITDGPGIATSTAATGRYNDSPRAAWTNPSGFIQVSLPGAKTPGGGTWIQQRALCWDDRTGIRQIGHETAWPVDDLTGTATAVAGAERYMCVTHPDGDMYGINILGMYGPYNFGLDETYRTVTDVTHDFTYTWYDSTAAGTGTHETTVGPTVTSNGQQFASARVRLPDIAGVSNDDAPDSVRLYIKETAESASALVWDRITPEPGLSLAPWAPYFSTFLGPGTGTKNVNVGTPTTNSFTAANLDPASLLSAKQDGAGALIKLSGDGSGRAGEISWDTTGATSWVQPHFDGYISANVNVPHATWFTIPIDVTSIDGALTWNATTRVLTVTKGGVYLLKGQVNYASNNSGTRYVSIITGTGDRVAYNATPTASGGSVVAETTRPIRLAAGTTLELQGHQNSGGTLAAVGGAGFTHMTVTRLGS